MNTPSEPSASRRAAAPDSAAAPTARDTADSPLWIVWRQDDNGHQFEVARHTDRAAADAQAAQMQARGHKQMYWVARAGA